MRWARGYWSDNGRSVSLGNVYADNQAYWLALTRTITKADGTSASTPSDAERRTAALMLAIGANPSGVETNVRDLTATDNVVGIAVQMWVTATTMARSQGATAPAIDSVTSVGVYAAQRWVAAAGPAARAQLVRHFHRRPEIDPRDPDRAGAKWATQNGPRHQRPILLSGLSGRPGNKIGRPGRVGP
jgi:hypothetical protein